MLKISQLLLLLFLLTSCSGLRTVQYSVGEILTSHGSILIWLYDETPVHKENFIALANVGYWNDFTFNRVIKDFVIQGGCPDTPAGFAYSIHLLAPEFREKIRHTYGTFAAGRDDNPKKLSAGCQFYIVQDKNGIARLDDNYTAYGKVFKGMDVVEKIVKVETDSSDKPIKDINLQVSIILMSASELLANGFKPPN
ncbi:MAG: peptidyl-prolyl cis-trans isomerase B (cyclophilin B) [Flavobacterium sp.]|jgi:peptidyl-prolyl cis-trans isomerase B (cyclophilin B)